MKVSLASVPFSTDVPYMLKCIESSIIKASEQHSRVICFPEACIPGMRGVGIEIPDVSENEMKEHLVAVCEMAKKHCINVILPMEYYFDGKRMIVAFFIGYDGEIKGKQTKNQLDPAEDGIYCAGNERELFEVYGVKLGITICHEGFRYPETVRWAARRGAKIVFHPYCAGSDEKGANPRQWLDPNAPYYEKAIMCRAVENTVYVASVNFAFRYQDAATCIVAPDGELAACLPYGASDVLTYDVDISKATGLLAQRCRIDLYDR